MDAHVWKGRYILLGLNCFIGFSCYFNVDIPSALQAELQDNINCTISLKNITCCKECLSLGPDRYNQLYAVYFWMFAVLAMPGGLVIDRVGNRVSFVVSTLVAFIGTFLFGLGTSPWLRHSSLMFPLLISGRFFLGIGTMTVRIVQDRFIAFWFYDKLEMAFGIVVSCLRIGNVLNFFVTATIAEHFSVSVATWTGACCTGIGFLSSLVLFVIDYKGSKRIATTEDNVKVTTNSLNIKALTKFSKTYWLLVLMIMAFYSAFLPFVSNGCKLIQDKYGYDRQTASFLNGINYDVTVVLCPVLGYILNKTGRRSLVATIGAFILLLIFPVISYTQIPAVIFPIVVGMVYTFMALSVWPSITKLVELKYNGTANGTALSLHGVAVGLTSLAIGKWLESLQRKYRTDEMKAWNNILLLLMSLACVCFIIGVFICIHEKKNVTSDSNITTMSRNIQEEETKALLSQSTRGEA